MFVPHMPCSGSAADGNKQISHSEGSRQSDVPLVSISEDAKEETVAVEGSETPSQSAGLEATRTEATRHTYRRPG